MKVKDVFKPRVKACTPVTSLDAVGRIMWESDSGAVPVVDAEGKVTGILTDRDLAMAMAAKNRGSSQILVRELTSGEIFTCIPEDELAEAIQKMRTNRIRRLPVIDAQGQLLGMLSLKDLALAATGSIPEATLVALSANSLNLLDTRPGRALKAFLAGAVLVRGPAKAYLPIAVLLAPYDLREMTMLGDAGSNALGAVLGFGSVGKLTARGRLLAIAALAGLTIVGETRSLGKLIERTPFLLHLDRLGRA